MFNKFSVNEFLLNIWPKEAISIQNNKDLNSQSASHISEHTEGYFHIDTQWSREQ